MAIDNGVNHAGTSVVEEGYIIAQSYYVLVYEAGEGSTRRGRFGDKETANLVIGSAVVDHVLFQSASYVFANELQALLVYIG